LHALPHLSGIVARTLTIQSRAGALIEDQREQAANADLRRSFCAAFLQIVIILEEYGVQVFVRDNDINAALRVLKKKMQREGTFREMKRRRSYEKPSERRAREKAEAIRRTRKALRKRMEREGY
jgi:small subunit ribosomal protein S21